MNTKKVIEIQNRILQELKNIWETSNQGTEKNLILDNFLDKLEIKKNRETRFIAYSRISELRVEPLELYLDEMQEKIENNNKKLGLKLPNKLENKQNILDKAYNYVKNIYEDLFEKFIYELEKDSQQFSLTLGNKNKELKITVDSFELDIFKGTLKVGKAFNNFMPIWQNAITKQNNILDKKFENNSEKIMNYLRENNLLDTDEFGNIVDRSYSVLIAGKSRSYFEAFPNEVGNIIFELDNFIEKISLHLSSSKGKEIIKNYINYLTAIKNALSETDTSKLLQKWQKVDEAWMDIRGPIQISHPLEFYEDKYRKAVAPEWDLRILDTETIDSKVELDIENMYEKLYNLPLGAELLMKDKYKESYSFSKSNFKRVQLYISEPVMYFGSELNGLFSAQVVPNDEVVSAKFGKKIFAFPKMVLDGMKKAPLMKLSKEVLDEKLLKNYLEIIDNDKLFFKIYDIETIGHEFGHTLWNTKDNELIMNSKTGNFKNIEEFKATTGGLVSYFMNSHLASPKGEGEKNPGKKYGDDDFEKNLIIMHLIRCIGLLKYREVADVLPYYNEVLIHLDIMLESGILEIITHSNPLFTIEGKKGFKIKLNFTQETYNLLKNNYIKHYKKLINIYLEKIDAGDFLFDYIVVDKKGNNISKNLKLREFGEYYFNLYKKIGNEVI